MKKYVYEIYDKCGCLWGTLLAILCFILVLAIVCGVYCLWGWIFMILWNWLAVDLFGAKVLGYWICVGITFALHWLGKLIFGRIRINTND
jgi:hypothetical protein